MSGLQAPQQETYHLQLQTSPLRGGHRGVLLVGPSGGKTTIVKCLADAPSISMATIEAEENEIENINKRP